MIVVSDTTPLNILAQLGLTELLPQLFGSVIITPAIVAELSHTKTPDVVRQWLSNRPSWLTVQAPQQLIFAEVPEGLGEREAISLAVELHADLLLADDKRARRAAQTHGLSVTGTLGILDAAATKRLIDLPAAVAKLRQTTFHVSEDLLEVLLNRGRRGTS